MGSMSNNPAAADDDGRMAGAGDPPESSEPGNAAGAAVELGRDNSAKEADDWLAAGAEEAGYGYGV
jgi:hypothetical protein